MNTPSVVPPLQQRIVTLLEEQGPIGAKEIRLWLKGVDGIALDTQLEALKRSGQIVLSGSIYSRASESAGDVPDETPQIPSAAEEAAASLQPTRDQVNALALECAQATRRAARAASPKPSTPALEKQCTECMDWKPLVEFRLIGGPNGNTRAERCNKCHGKPIRAAKAQKVKAAAESPPACESGSIELSAKLLGIQTFAPYEPVYADTVVSMPKPGDKCPHCGGEWLASPGGKGVWHNCHTGAAIASVPEQSTVSVTVDIAELVRQRRQDIANQIELARVALDNLVNKQLEYDRFLELHERLSAEVAA